MHSAAATAAGAYDPAPEFARIDTDVRARQDDAEVARKLQALEAACATDENLVPYILECARTYCTLFEIRHAMEKVFGSYKEPVFF